MFSVIIPTFNEEGYIGSTIRFLQGNMNAGFIREIIVADGGSSDNTIAESERCGCIVRHCDKKGRAAQMNEGAKIATGELLYFLHADTLPSLDFIECMLSAYAEGFESGCFRLKFDHPHWFLRLNCWFTRFDLNAFRFGDQSLMVTNDIFGRIGGFDESLIVMEDQEILSRIRKHCRFKVIDRDVRTSARKYLRNGVYKTQAVFFLIYFMYQLGASQQRLLSTYKRLIRQEKL